MSAVPSSRALSSRGDEVTTLTRGESGPPAHGASARYADRTDPLALAAALGDDEWDAVVDTWSLAPRVVRDSARLLSGRAGHYTYISSRSVYVWPIPVGADESAPVVAGDPASEAASDYAEAKRGAELAALEGFDGPVLVARPGLILGPYERVGTVAVLAPPDGEGRAGALPGTARPTPAVHRWSRPCRLGAGRRGARSHGGVQHGEPSGAHHDGGTAGLCRTVTGSDAELVWVSPEAVAAAGVAPWTELPIWLPPTGEYAGLHDGDVSAAFAAGLTCRPVTETVADTWAWLQAEGLPAPAHPERGAIGMDAAAEARLLQQ